MCPVLFHIGSFPVRSFGLLLVLGFVVGILWSQRRAARHGIEPSKVWDAAFWMIILGILGARLAFVVQEWDYYSKNPGELLAVQFVGLTSFGGLIFGFVGLALWARSQKLRLLTAMDLFGAPVLVAHAFGRVGCLMNGCCYGGPTDHFPGVHFVGVSGLHHPAQLYDAAMVLIGAVLVTFYERTRPLPGRSAGLAIAAYGTSRFVYEFWRAGTEQQVREGIASSTYWGSLPITQAQAMSLFAVLVGIALIAFAPRRVSSQPAE